MRLVVSARDIAITIPMIPGLAFLADVVGSAPHEGIRLSVQFFRRSVQKVRIMQIGRNIVYQYSDETLSDEFEIDLTGELHFTIGRGYRERGETLEDQLNHH